MRDSLGCTDWCYRYHTLIYGCICHERRMSQCAHSNAHTPVFCIQTYRRGGSRTAPTSDRTFVAGIHCVLAYLVRANIIRPYDGGITGEYHSPLRWGGLRANVIRPYERPHICCADSNGIRSSIIFHFPFFIEARALRKRTVPSVAARARRSG